MMIRFLTMLSVLVASVVSIEAAVVSGTVTDSVTTTIKIANAAVSLRRGNTTLYRDTTGTDGIYSFTTTAADTGSLSVRVTATGYTQKSVTVGAVTADQTVNVALAPLPPPTYSTITGTIADSTTPATVIVGARVIVRSGFGGGFGSADTVTTDANGKYTVDSLTGTSYTVTVAMGGYVGRSVTVAIATAGGTTTRDIKLYKAQYSTITGKVTDSNGGAGLDSVRVSFSTSRRDSTDASGNYQVDSVNYGTYTVTVSRRGYAQQTIDSVVVSAATTTLNAVLVKIVYGTISGTVTSGGTALDLTRVSVSRTGFTTRRDSTDAAGAYAVDSLPYGTYVVTTSRTGYVTKVDSNVVIDAATKTFAIVLTKVEYSSIAGKVTDSTSGNPIPYAVVSTGSGGSTRRDTADATGNYSLDSVPTGTYTLSARDTAANAHVTKTAVVTTSGTATQTVNFVLPTSVISKVTGKITGPNGAALANIAIRLTPSAGGTAKYDTTDANGMYSIDSVRSGDYSMRVRDTLNQHVYDSTFTLTTRGTADVVVNVQVQPDQASAKAPMAIAARTSLIITAGVLQLASTDAGNAKVYNANGRCMFVQSFGANTATLALPSSIRSTPGAYVVRVTQKANVVSKQFVVR